MKLDVTNTNTKATVSFDGARFSGDERALKELDRLVLVGALLPAPNPHDPQIKASLTGSDETLVITLRYAVAPEAPYASFVTVEAIDPNAPKPAKPPQAGNVRSTGMGRGQGQKDTSILYQRLPLTPEVLEFKGGLISSGSRSTQFAEALISAGVPGDMSDVRKPIRSRAYAAITPGGKNRRRSIGNIDEIRCPPGFEHGGRFTNRALNNCGRRLFVNVAQNLARSGASDNENGNRDGNPFDMSLVGLLEGESITIGGGRFAGRAAQIVRNAEIQPVGKRNDNALYGAISRNANILDDPSTPDSLRLVRRDGVVLKPSVPLSTLARSNASPDMDGGVFVSVRRDPTKIGDAEIPVLLRSELRGVAFAIPGGGNITMEKRRPLSTGDKRRLTRVWATSQAVDNYDFAAPMRRLAEQSNGAITYRESFPYKGADDMVGITNGKRTTSVRRWVYNAFLDDKAPASIGEEWKLTDATPTRRTKDSTLGTLAEAVKFLNDGGDPRDVPPLLLGDGLQRARSYKRRNTGDGIRVYQRGDTTFYEMAAKADFQHLAHRFASDVQEQLGLESPDVIIMDAPARRRRSLIEFPTGELDDVDTYDKASPADLLRLAMADFLTDQVTRDQNSLAVVMRASQRRLIAADNGGSGLAGMTPARRSSRQRLGIDDFYSDQRKKDLLDKFSNLTDKQKQLLLGTYDDALKRAKRWSIEDYIETLTIDGELSDAERIHLAAMRALYGRRTNQLSTGKAAFLRTLGITS